MLNIREESLKNILSVVPDEKIIAALGKEKLLAALSKEEMIAALGGKENLLKMLLAELDPKQLHKLLEEKSMN
jgi:hypothetical protein